MVSRSQSGVDSNISQDTHQCLYHHHECKRHGTQVWIIYTAQFSSLIIQVVVGTRALHVFQGS